MTDKPEKLKVYELAKELGVDSLGLIDHFKALDIDVKSHMSSVTAEEADKVKQHLKNLENEKNKPADSKKPRKTTTRKATTATTAKTTSTAKTPPKAALKTKQKETEVSAATPAPKRAAGTTVIRRRAKTSGDETIVTTTVTTTTVAETENAQSAADELVQTTDAHVDSNTAVEQSEASIITSPEVLVASETVASESASELRVFKESDLLPREELIAEQQKSTKSDQPEAIPAADVTLSSTTPSEPVIAEPTTVTKTTVTQTAANIQKTVTQTKTVTTKVSSSTATSTGSGLKFPSLLGARNSGMAPAKTSSILTIIAEDPKPIVRQPTITPKTGATAGASTGGLRPGMPGYRPAPIVTPRDPKDIEEENAKKKIGGGKVEKEKEAKDANVFDFKAKKELVFLPKKKKIPLNKEIRRTQITTPAAHKRVVRIENVVSVGNLAQAMGVKANELIKKLMGMGTMATMNQMLDFDTAQLLANEFQYEVENVAFKEETVLTAATNNTDAPESLLPRPPVVTVMGHVDHGKTSLLDAIRSAKVAAGEAGGITQHIGAYTVDLKGKKITFIDTPGHEAFTVMRARGANVTDIVILVVAADDGVMPQTREAVDHARAAGVPIIVAVNKIDKPNANPDRVMQGLSELSILSEAWGGENIFVNVSALARTGIDELLEAILLQAEVLDLKANPNRKAEGSVLEARLDKGRGPVVNILIKHGTLRTGDYVVAGQHCGRVRALTDDKGKQLKEVGPGYAAELLGLEGVPLAGDALNSTESDEQARKVAEHRVAQMKAQEAAKTTKRTLEDIMLQTTATNLKELPLILKADVFGSAEAIKDSLLKLSNERVKIKLLSTSTGGISESDVMLASASNAIILGFNVRPETKARAIAENKGIEIRSYSIIYELLADIKKAMAGLLDKKQVEKYLGRAEVRETFVAPKFGTIAGCSVVDGKILRGCSVRLLRDSRVIYTGKLGSLRRFKDDAKEVAQGYECGMSIENFNDIKVGDLIEAFAIEMIAQDMDEALANPTPPPTNQNNRNAVGSADSRI